MSYDTDMRDRQTLLDVMWKAGKGRGREGGRERGREGGRDRERERERERERGRERVSQSTFFSRVFWRSLMRGSQSKGTHTIISQKTVVRKRTK
jgi:hypothetical protein